MTRIMKNGSLKQKRIISLIFFLIYLGCLFLLAQESPRKYIAYKTQERLFIDGKADENAWEKVPWSQDFIDIEGVLQPRYKTNMKMLWDEQYLYFFAQMQEPHVWATLKQRDTVIFYNNDFEIFIDPDGDTHNYMEFEMNALNTIWDLFLTKPYRNQGKVLDSWDIQGLKSAVYVKGTLNNSSDVDDGWNVEIALPWNVLVEANSHGNVPENEFWRIGFSRVNWNFDLDNGTYSRKKDDKGNFLPEYNWVWSPQWVINMHEPEKWGYVYFSTKTTGSGEGFDIPKDEHIKWYLYDLYRDKKNKNGGKMIWERKASNDHFFGPAKSVLGKKVQPLLEQSGDEISIWAISPFTGKKLVVKDDGKFKSYESD